jgi:short-subunit dehydrogenase
MISSVAGKNTSPFVGAYAASKHALEGYSGTLRRELMLFGIDVIIVGPGAVKTPIWDKPRLEPFLNTPFAPALRRTYDIMQSMAAKGLAPERCADLILEILTTPRPKVRYALVPQPLINWYLPRWLPARWVDRIVASRLGLKPPEKSR